MGTGKECELTPKECALLHALQFDFLYPHPAFFVSGAKDICANVKSAFSDQE
jgi:hypothetical protein